MRRCWLLVTLLVACGDGREVPPGTPQSGDAGTISYPDAASCEDMLDAAIDLCTAGPSKPIAELQPCVYAAIDRFTPCLGESRACDIRCGWIDAPPSELSEAINQCVNACPLPDAGASDR